MFEIFGVGRDEAPPSMSEFRSRLLLAEDADHVERALLEAMHPGAIFQCACRIRRKSDRDLRWLEFRAQFEFDPDGAPLRLVGVVADITERKRDDEVRKLLMMELNHRVKNTLAIVQAIAHQSLSSDRPAYEQRAVFEGRLQALAGAHDLLTRERWETASLAELVDNARQACGIGVRRFAFSGPQVKLQPQRALTIALVLHELCSNARKHGSLASEAGRVSVCWSIGEDRDGAFRLHWVERDGRVVAPPGRRGFGMRLLERAVAAELGGTVAVTFEPVGLSCTIEAPLVEEQRV
jgi:two-component sensor histidine kinase